MRNDCGKSSTHFCSFENRFHSVAIIHLASHYMTGECLRVDKNRGKLNTKIENKLQTVNIIERKKG